ncbi:MAG: hypothetical protein IJA26_02800 [Clostridia bacterium]|nr:hypothetical protein [Clostridia bacterium]
MLPGKLCIGILEEDNPLKSYFRLKPLLVETDGKYEPFEGADTYPEDGCIRIVPDKNESSHFKARMRRMGRYCVLDLREHAGANDKIRPNKNYKNDEIENNAYIIYSDVVREPADDMIFEIAAEDAGEVWAAAPGTARVLLGDKLETWKYTAPEAEGESGKIEKDGESLIAEDIQVFNIPGFRDEMVHIAVKLPGAVENVIGVPAAQKAAAEAKPAPKAEIVSQPAASEPAADQKPWICREAQPAPQAMPKLNALDQKLAAQSGLNPRRSRSLQEIIEEKWRHSRVDQLGHPIPVNAMGHPVESPVEQAVNAIKNAWDNADIRAELLGALAGMEEFSDALDIRKKQIADLALQRELEDLEAERLRTLAEIDKLRQQKISLRDTFKQEIREEEAEALKEYTESTRIAKEEYEKYREEADSARKDAEFARDAFAALNDGRFEKRLRDHVLLSRAAEILKTPEKKVYTASDEKPDRAAWIARVVQAFAMEGIAIEEIEAANLLICAAINNRIILSGSASSDKAGYARAIARALGAKDAGRFAEIHGKAKDIDIYPEDDLPAVVYIHEANAQPGKDIYGGVSAKDRNMIVISGAMDMGSGFPLSAEAMERAFMVRLQPAAADMPWKPAVRRKVNFTPVRMHTLRDVFCIDAVEMPVALDRRMKKFRQDIARFGVRLSRNTLDQLWGYCSAMLALNKLPIDEVLDRGIAQKALPCILAEAPVECLKELPALLSGMPHCLALLKQPLPILI